MDTGITRGTGMDMDMDIVPGVIGGRGPST
jgi:hypothetical protein